MASTATWTAAALQRLGEGLSTMLTSPPLAEAPRGADPTCRTAWSTRWHRQETRSKPRRDASALASAPLDRGVRLEGSRRPVAAAASAASAAASARRCGSLVQWLLLAALLAAAPPAEAFCPQGCVCNTLRISCESAGLDVVPFQLNPEANTLTLRGNNIITLEYTVNFYQQLQYLDLSANRLQSLGSKNFDALDRLVNLNVSRNEIASFGKDVFKGLRALRVLDLSDNLIESLDRHMFAEMHDLWELYLGHNRLAAIEPGVLDALANLRVLHLGDNQLLVVPGPAMQRLTSLRALTLNGNLIEDLAGGAFAALRELSVLALQDNVIAEVHATAFDGLVALERLDLADNNLTAVPTAALSRLHRLSYLDLSGNMFAFVGPVAFHALAELRVLRLNRLVRLTRVDARAFADNKRLESASLEGDVRLTALPTRLFHGSPLLSRVSVRGSALASLDAAHFPLDRLHVLDVADVPLTCNCSLLWLWVLGREQLGRQRAEHAATSPNDTAATPGSVPSTVASVAAVPQALSGSESHIVHPFILDLDRIRCAGPTDLKGFVLVDVPEGDVRCEASWMTVIMVTVVVLALFAATCTVLFFLSSGRWCSREKDTSDVSTDSFATQHSTLHKHAALGAGLGGGLGSLGHGLPRVAPPHHPHPTLPAGPVMMLPSDMKMEPTYATIGLPSEYDHYKKEAVNVNVNAYQHALNNWDSSFNGNGTHHHTLTMGRHHGDQIRHGGSPKGGNGHGPKAPKGVANGPGSYGTYHNHNHYSMAIDMTKKPPHIVYV